MSTSHDAHRTNEGDAPHGWRSRVIDLASLDAPIKRVLAVGYAALIGLGAATAAHAWLPGGETLANPGVTFPLAAVIIAGVGVSLAVALMLTGASQASSTWRLLLFAPLFLWSSVIMAAQAATPMIAVSAVGLFFIIAAGALLLLGPRLGWRLSFLTAGAICGVLAIVAIAISLDAIPSYAPTLVLLALAFAIPVVDTALVVTGWDIAEVALLSASPLARVSPDARPRHQAAARLALAMTAIAAALWLNDAYHGSADWIVLARAAGLAAVAFAVGWGIVRWGWTARAGAHDHVGYWSAFAIAACLLLSIAIQYQFTEPPHGAYNYNGTNKFSLMLPDDWIELKSWSLPLDKNEGKPIYPVRKELAPAPSKGNFPRFGIFGTIAPPFAPAEKVLPQSISEIVGGGGLPRIPLPTTVPDGAGWEKGETTFRTGSGKLLTFVHWRQDIRTPMPDTNKSWYLICVLGPGEQAHQRATCEEIKQSLRYEPRAQVTPLSKLLFGEVFWAAIAIGAAWAAWRGRRGPMLAFLMWVALLAVVRLTGGAGGSPALMDHGLSADMLSASLLFGAVALAGAEFTFFGIRSHVSSVARGAALSFLLTTLLVAAAFALYVTVGEGAHHYHEVRGAVICLALTWELWTSGASMTNQDSAAFPRRARVLFFIGYLIIVATCVFFFVEREFDFVKTTVQAWDSEGWVAFGIVNLGLAFVFMRHVERIAAVLRDNLHGGNLAHETSRAGMMQGRY